MNAFGKSVYPKEYTFPVVLFVSVISKYLNFARFLKDL
jgi:hypothetical protein